MDNPRFEFLRWQSHFGTELASEYFAEGLTFEQAQAKYRIALKAENEKLKKQIGALTSCEARPLTTGGADEKRNGRTGFGFGSRIRVNDAN